MTAAVVIVNELLSEGVVEGVEIVGGAIDVVVGGAVEVVGGERVVEGGGGGLGLELKGTQV